MRQRLGQQQRSCLIRQEMPRAFADHDLVYGWRAIQDHEYDFPIHYKLRKSTKLCKRDSLRLFDGKRIQILDGTFPWLMFTRLLQPCYFLLPAMRDAPCSNHSARSASTCAIEHFVACNGIMGLKAEDICQEHWNIHNPIRPSV